MSYAKQLLDTYPRSFNVDAGLLARTIDALSDCAQACTACAASGADRPAYATAAPRLGTVAVRSPNTISRWRAE